ncbi:hypothetical protein [Tengunoibacter tsumagoiensis]|uniref:Uncharacterized protein n=1 Tax=Tengunoibacter tsumagoiensis TaxID=2014871 RepID=A0A402A4W6_9CHLR|nr:hypothetical protein [Tengunoibacter tsumagoiensis]GCE14194.1 hypothetical protein KTT_40530 [Tengunoibacter tsumagoiensis]GCE14248.1 hypothetical protein KTT_41070 [Tengunoibacter tsumagoiensis]
MAKKNQQSSATSAEREIQQQSEETAQSDEILAVTLRMDNSFEYHLNLKRSVLAGILDPDVGDVFIEVPCPVAGTKRFLHTSRIKELDARGL